MAGVSLREVLLHRDRAAMSTLSLLAAGLALIGVVLFGFHFFFIVFAPATARAYAWLLHDIPGLLGLPLALYAAYRWHPAVGVWGMLLFVAAHMVYFFLYEPENLRGVLHILLVSTVVLIGIGIIAELRRAVGMVQRREHEISALGDLTARALNERIQFLEDANQNSQRLLRLQEAISLAGEGGKPVGVARQLLRLVQAEVGAEYGSFTLVGADGTLGERVDSFLGVESFVVAAHPRGLAEEVLRSQETQCIADTGTDPRANPDLVAAGIRSYLGVPIRAGGRVVGILFLHSVRSHALGKEQRFLESIAEVLGGVMVAAELNADVEHALRERDVTFDAIADGAVVVDEERRLIRANRAFARMVGKPPQELTGQNMCMLVHGTEEPIPGCPLEQAIATGSPQALERREPHLGDRVLELRVFPMPVGEGQPARLLHLVRVKAEQ